MSLTPTFEVNRALYNTGFESSLNGWFLLL